MRDSIFSVFIFVEDKDSFMNITQATYLGGGGG